MFCPKCAGQNIDGASFCRVCGANISLVPQALTGELAQAPASDYDSYRSRRMRRREGGPPSLEKGIVNIFMGIGFMLAALAVMFKFPGGVFWGWSFFIPAFSSFGRGVAQIVASRKNQAAQLSAGTNSSQMFASATQNFGSQSTLAEPGARRTGELLPTPPSVTEGTTRHLGAEAPTKHLDASGEAPK